MAEPPVPDATRRAFSDVTGAVEDAALIACRGRSARSRVVADQCSDEPIVAIERVLARLWRLRGNIT